MRVDYLNSLRALEAVLRNGGLRPAAEDLGVTPAAIGQQIRKLEDYLGIALLERHPTGSTPTTRANSVASELTNHMTGLSDVLQRLKSPKDSNRVSLSVLPSFAEMWFPRHLSTLFAQMPGLDLRLDSSSKLVNFLEGEYDFAIRYAREPSSDLDYELLLEDFCAPICTPQFSDRYGLSRDSKSLEGVPMAEIDIQALASSGTVPGLIDWCARFEVEPPKPSHGQVTLSYSGGRKLASFGLAIFLAGLHDVIGELEAGDIILPFGRDKVLLNEHKFWLVWQRDIRLSSTQRGFVRWILDHAAEDRRRISRFLVA